MPRFALRPASKRPTNRAVILVKTVKGDGIDHGAGKARIPRTRRKTSQPRRTDQDLRPSAFGIPLPDDDALAVAQFLSATRMTREELRICCFRTSAFTGRFRTGAQRRVACPKLNGAAADREMFADLLKDGTEVHGPGVISTTTAAVRTARKTVEGSGISVAYVVPIVPDEARTFGMDALFRVAGRHLFTRRVKNIPTGRCRHEPVELHRKRKTVSCCRKGSAKPAPWHRFLPPVPHTRCMACR